MFMLTADKDQKKFSDIDIVQWKSTSTLQGYTIEKWYKQIIET